MPKEPDVNDLFELYRHLQNLMTYHVEIDETLKELSFSESHPQDFDPIETAASAIIETCDEIQKIVDPQRCHCCQLA